MDIRENRKVCFIGQKVYETLFTPGENPVGQIIRFNSIYYRVIGVGTGLSNVQIGGRTDEMVVLPFTTLQIAYNQGDNVHFLAATAVDEVDAGYIEQAIKTLLKKRHHIAPSDDQAVGGFNISEQFNMFKYLFLGIRILIWIVGIGTLLAGAIGVSNIMLVSVKERTKEIGIRRAIGAKPKDIILQIMEESLVLTAAAGFIGLSTGVGILAFFDHLIQNLPPENGLFLRDIMIRLDIATAASLILIGMGLLAGLLPAWRAMQIKPIEALAEE
jgi:putative ABC transport system permease protein